jgi:hypothetical protein
MIVSKAASDNNVGVLSKKSNCVATISGASLPSIRALLAVFRGSCSETTQFHSLNPFYHRLSTPLIRNTIIEVKQYTESLIVRDLSYI